MQSPHIGIETWWTVSLVITVALWLYLIPLMPNRRYKLQIAAIPVVMALFGVASSLAKGMTLEQLLPMYTAALGAILFGLFGQGAKVRELMAEMVEAGADKPRSSTSINVQLAVSCCVMLFLWGWLTHFGTP